MNFRKIVFSLTAFIVGITSVVSIPLHIVNAVDEDYNTNLTEYYRRYLENDEITADNIQSNSSELRIFSNKFSKNDYAVIVVDSDKELEINSLAEKTGIDEECATVSCDFFESDNINYIYVQFFSINHDENLKSAFSLKELIEEEYTEYIIKDAYAIFDITYYNDVQIIKWSQPLYTIDEFGYFLCINEEFSKRRFEKINNEISENKLMGKLNSETGILIFDDNADEMDKIKLALWLKDNYRIFYNIEFLPLERVCGKLEVMHYTEIKGDVNNDNLCDYIDLNMMSRFLLGESLNDFIIDSRCFNYKNADIDENGVVNAIDLSMLRQLLNK